MTLARFSRSEPWRPLLSGRDLDEATIAVDAIARSLRSRARRDADPSLSSGLAGNALFFAYLAKAREDVGARRTAARLLERAVEVGWEASLPAHLYGGFVGIGWTIEHLRRGFDLAAADEDLCESVDGALLEL